MIYEGIEYPEAIYNPTAERTIDLNLKFSSCLKLSNNLKILQTVIQKIVSWQKQLCNNQLDPNIERYVYIIFN